MKPVQCNTAVFDCIFLLAEFRRVCKTIGQNIDVTKPLGVIYSHQGPPIYEVHMEAESSSGGPMLTGIGLLYVDGYPHRTLEPIDLILSSSHAKKFGVCDLTLTLHSRGRCVRVKILTQCQ